MPIVKRHTKTKPRARKTIASIPLPTLKKGEHWAGIVLNSDGTTSHHLVLLPGEAENVTWAQAKTWAKKTGGELPTRQEQALLYANLKAQFQSALYWSCEQPAGYPGNAWLQGFDYGSQSYWHKDNSGRARAVRREAIVNCYA